MFLGRSESVKWIRKKFSKRSNSFSNSKTSNEKHTPSKVTKVQSGQLPQLNVRDLNEILVVTNTPAAATTTTHSETTITLDIPDDSTITNTNNQNTDFITINLSNDSNNDNDDISQAAAANKQIAPIASCEDEEEMEETKMEKNTNQQSDIEPATECKSNAELMMPNNESSAVQRSKSSRVRNYLRKCKDRWLAHTLPNSNLNTKSNQLSNPKALNQQEHEADAENYQRDAMQHEPATLMPPTTTSSQTVMTTKGNQQLVNQDNYISMITVSQFNNLAQTNDQKNNPIGNGNRTICPINALGTVEKLDEQQDRACNRNNTDKVIDDDDDDDDEGSSYEDIDFGLRSIISATPTTNSLKQTDKMPTTNDKKTTQQANEQYQFIVGSMSDHNQNVAADDADDDDAIVAKQEKQLATNKTHVSRASLPPPPPPPPPSSAVSSLTSAMQESQIATMIDSYLACIYPIFTQTTRAVLIREARDVLVSNYHGCLQTFEKDFLCKFAEIVATLRDRHQYGEAIVWCQGWPLVTPIGEVILHLGDLDDDQLRPAEIYLCVKKVDTNQEPQLFAIWRTPLNDNPTTALRVKNNTINEDNCIQTTSTTNTTLESGSTLKSCQLEYQIDTLYLSPLTLEMLNDDLPQLLQSLLIGVENSLGRLSLNDVQPQDIAHYNCDQYNSAAAATTPAAAANDSYGTLAKSSPVAAAVSTILTNAQLTPNSPKCALRRSELITKNKLQNNKYLLRRLTNRQDSMNSTSSGNSSASGLSSASSSQSSSNDSGSYTKATTTVIAGSYDSKNYGSSNTKNSSNFGHAISKTSSNNCKNNESTNETKSNDDNTSPALPRFCLGSTFPHIDSDEENPEDRKNSLGNNQLESEIKPPNLITDLPEKLLLSGIYLPGTRDLKGNPLITVDADLVSKAGLNCYEIATLLLYYSTIPENSVHSTTLHPNAETLDKAIIQRSQRQQQQLNQLTILPTTAKTTTTATTAPATSTIETKTVNTTATTSVTTVTQKSTCTYSNDNKLIQQQQQQQHQQQTAQQQPDQPQNKQKSQETLQLQDTQQRQQHHVTFTFLIAIEKSQHLCVIDLISQSLKLLTRQIAYCELLVICNEPNLLKLHKSQRQQQQQCAADIISVAKSDNESTITTGTITNPSAAAAAYGDSNDNCNVLQADIIDVNEMDTNGICSNKKNHKIKFISVDEVTTSAAPSQTPIGRVFGDSGLHQHDERKWREFFQHYEPFYQQCAGAAKRLVTALSDMRCADLQGLPTRRQLYAQHRALSRALMDSELHNLRKRGTGTLARLQELAKSLSSTSHSHNNQNNDNDNGNGTVSGNSSYCSLKEEKNKKKIRNNSPSLCNNSYGGSNISYYSSSTLNRCKILGSSSSYSFQSNQNRYNSYSSSISSNNSHTSYNSAATIIKSPSAASNGKTSKTTTSSNIPIIKSYSAIKTSSSSAAASSSSSLPLSLTLSNIHNSSIASRPNHSNNNNLSTFNHNMSNSISNISNNFDVAIRLQKVTLLFNEIDHAAKRLEHLTEQRRERLRELTRQRALEDEINEVTSWIANDGSESLQRFINFELDCDTPIKEREQEFEKYYFISMKHLAKGRDLHVAASALDSLRDSATNLKTALDSFGEKLEKARERIEGASRLYYLINLQQREESQQHEMNRLAMQFGVKGLLVKYRDKTANETDSLNQQKSHMYTSTPDGHQKLRSQTHGYTMFENAAVNSRTGGACQCWRDSRNLDDIDEMLDNDEEEEGQSKIADSGVGGCQQCEESDSKFTRVCSCQSLNDESGNLYGKSDELDDVCFEQTSKHYLNVQSPLEANKHLQCFASTFELPHLEELNGLEPKIQKTLLLIMREMIGTERDYVRSLYYVIDNYIEELLRDDIPQPLRGQRNVIFGNIEKIFEFHNNHFLAELERYEHSPLKVGAAFLQMESKFYLYALYNKNKPKSDTLMSEYGTTFFKSKQLELTDKMDLASYLLKPVQRMGKYALLLQQLVKACGNVKATALPEIISDVEELQKAEEMVKFQLRHGNDLLAMDSLRDCDVNVKEQGRLLRQNEFLVWQGRGGKKSLRQVFLFEELVLFSKARRFPDHKNLDIYLYKNSIKTSDIGLTAHISDYPTKFEIWFRKRKPEDTFTLQCMSEDIKNAWTEEISKLLWQQAKRNREIRLAEMSSMGIGSKPCLDIRPSNNQINDRSITINQLGKAPKFRNSFIGLHSDTMKSSHRPNSLISDCSISSGTSSSSLSKSSTASSSSSSAAAATTGIGTLSHQHHQATTHLELINECQALDNSSHQHRGAHHHYHSHQHNRTHQQQHEHHEQHHRPHSSCGLSSQGSNGGGIGCGGMVSGNSNIADVSQPKSLRCHRNNKRSTTIVSQLSMESGIISDICTTADQENNNNEDLIETTPSTCPTTRATLTTSTAKGLEQHFLNGDNSICNSSNINNNFNYTSNNNNNYFINNNKLRCHMTTTPTEQTNNSKFEQHQLQETQQLQQQQQNYENNFKEIKIQNNEKL